MMCGKYPSSVYSMSTPHIRRTLERRECSHSCSCCGFVTFIDTLQKVLEKATLSALWSERDVGCSGIREVSVAEKSDHKSLSTAARFRKLTNIKQHGLFLKR